MTTENNVNPYIATYWRGKGSEIPQYHIVYHDGAKWNVSGLNFRSAPFTLGGTGTKRIPISRPQVVPFMNDGVMGLLLVFRDEERGEKVSAAICTDISANEWEVRDLTDFPVGAWEPSFDTELWRKMHKLHLFVQNVDQVDGEGMSETGARMVYVLEVERQN